MESLYRKYRPLTFESVVGQQHIVSTLQHAVTEGRLSHAYLFCGPRGTGKTTMARILAKALLCQKAHGDHGCMPDGTCPECEAIAEGAHPDVYELDAASRTGVDSVREEIINSVNFAPVRGTYKVYIIDEVHMLTTQAFNALLKTLEEPPSHVVFVLCTTDPQKLLDTILSRCQRFDFHRISNEDILARMRYVCEQEGFSYDEEALEIVAKHARGGMRDALSTLEQLSVFGGGSVRLADARSLLGEVSSTILAQFARGIASRDVVELFGLVRTQVDEGNDLMELTRDLVGHVRDVYTAFVAGAKPELLDCTPEEATALKEEASHFENADRLARVLTVLDDAALEMRNASDMRLVLEIALTRLARPESDLTLEALAERLDRLEARIASGVPNAPMDAAALAALGGAVASASSAGASRPATSAPATSAAAPVGASAAAPAAAPSRPAPQPAASSPGDLPWMKNAQRPAASPSAPVTDAGELQRKWSDVVKRVVAAHPSRGALLQSARAASDDGSKLVVELPAGSGFAMKMLARKDSQSVIIPVAVQVFGQREVEFTMAGAPAPVPAAPASAPAPAAAPASSPAPVPQQSAPAPAPVPVAASSPAPSFVPKPHADMPATTSPTAVAPAAAPQADHTSGPTVVAERDIEADRKAWEDEQVPYDDAAIAAYEGDAEVPPMDLPADAAATPPAPAPTAVAPAAPNPALSASAPAAPSAPAAAPGALPWATHPGAEDQIPKNEEEAKSMLGDIFGPGIVFKPGE